MVLSYVDRRRWLKILIIFVSFVDKTSEFTSNAICIINFIHINRYCAYFKAFDTNSIFSTLTQLSVSPFIKSPPRIFR